MLSARFSLAKGLEFSSQQTALLLAQAAVNVTLRHGGVYAQAVRAGLCVYGDDPALCLPAEQET